METPKVSFEGYLGGQDETTTGYTFSDLTDRFTVFSSLTPAQSSVCEPRIQLVTQNPAIAPGGVISPPFKSMITNKPITFDSPGMDQ